MEQEDRTATLERLVDAVEELTKALSEYVDETNNKPVEEFVRGKGAKHPGLFKE